MSQPNLIQFSFDTHNQHLANNLINDLNKANIPFASYTCQSGAIGFNIRILDTEFEKKQLISVLLNVYR